MLDGRFKANIEKGLRPIGLNLRKTGITADHLTTLGVVMAAAAAVGVARVRLRVLQRHVVLLRGEPGLG